MADTDLILGTTLSPAEPLWKIAPTRDADGKPVSDFLMIIPKLSKKPKHYIQRTLSDIETVLQQFNHTVIFANIDMKLNTLWVSLKPKHGVLLEIVAAVKLRVPEAVIVSDMGSRLYK